MTRCERAPHEAGLSWGLHKLAPKILKLPNIDWIHVKKNTKHKLSLKGQPDFVPTCRVYQERETGSFRLQRVCSDFQKIYTLVQNFIPMFSGEFCLPQDPPNTRGLRPADPPKVGLRPPGHMRIMFGIPWYSMVLHGIPWHTMVFHGLPWYTWYTMVISWYFMVYHGIPWYTTVFHGFPWYTMVFHGRPWYTMVYHGIPW